MADHPWDEVLKAADEWIRKGATVYQKFTCEHCGNRLTIEEPNTFHETGTCDNCGGMTDIKKRGHNYLLHIERKPMATAEEVGLKLIRDYRDMVARGNTEEEAMLEIARMIHEAGAEMEQAAVLAAIVRAEGNKQ